MWRMPRATLRRPNDEEKGSTLLHHAAWNSAPVALVQLLLDRGADPKVRAPR